MLKNASDSIVIEDANEYRDYTGFNSLRLRCVLLQAKVI